MAMIDYGAVVIKNGRVINENQFFMDMQEAVGWVDVPKIRYDDCDCHDGKRSECSQCPRATYQILSDPELGEWRSTKGDCRGKLFVDELNKINDNYFAYIGDEHLTIAFYKICAKFVVDREPQFSYWGVRREAQGSSHKVVRFQVSDASIVIRAITYDVMYMTVDYRGDRYHVLYGYGIDPKFRVWNKIKVQYLGKKTARKVDNLYRKLIKEGVRP